MEDQARNKYHESARISSEVLSSVLALCVPGALIRDICSHGDSEMTKKISAVFNKNNNGWIEKGIAMPTCVNINNISSGYSPLTDDDTRLKEGDIVKVQLGVSIDGYVAHAGHTTIAKSDLSLATTGKAADVVCAAYFASELLLKCLSTGTSSESMMELVDRVVKVFHVQPVNGTICALTTKFVPENPQKMLVMEGDESPSQPFTVGEDEVYIVKVRMNSSQTETLVKEAPYKPTLAQRNIHKNINLKLQSGRSAFEELTAEFSVFPFAIRDLSSKTRLGLQECIQKDLFYHVPVLATKSKHVIAEFSFTAMVCGSTGKVTKLTNCDFPLPYVHSEYSLPEDLDQFLNAGSLVMSNTCMDMTN